MVEIATEIDAFEEALSRERDKRFNYSRESGRVRLLPICGFVICFITVNTCASVTTRLYYLYKCSRQS